MASSQDVRLSSSASAHRLPTVSASQALLNLKSRVSERLSTNIPQLDAALRPATSSTEAILGSGGGGLPRGQVVEIYGPSGVGKTTFAAHVCANAILIGRGAVWVDGANSIVQNRLDEILSAERPENASNDATSSSTLDLFRHYVVSSLPLLLALFVHPPASFPPSNTSIIVIDSLSTLFDNAYPRSLNGSGPSKKTDAEKWIAARRFTVMGELLSKLGKMAAMHDVTILVTCQTITRVRPGGGAVLLPALSGTEWDSGISIRLVLFRDWPPARYQNQVIDTEQLQKLRFVGVEKVSSSINADAIVGSVFPFTIEKSGIVELAIDSTEVTIQQLTSPIRPPKRPYAEIADSEDEDPDSDELYGWVEDDDIAAEGLVIDEGSLAAADQADNAQT